LRRVRDLPELRRPGAKAGACRRLIHRSNEGCLAGPGLETAWPFACESDAVALR